MKRRLKGMYIMQFKTETEEKLTSSKLRSLLFIRIDVVLIPVMSSDSHPINLRVYFSVCFLPIRAGPDGPAAGCVSEGGRAEPLVAEFRRVSDPSPQHPAGRLRWSPETPATEAAGTTLMKTQIFKNLFQWCIFMVNVTLFFLPSVTVHFWGRPSQSPAHWNPTRDERYITSLFLLVIAFWFTLKNILYKYMCMCEYIQYVYICICVYI